MNLRSISIAIAGLLAAATASQAQTIFSDNFNADSRGLNKSTFVGGWTVGSGTVDVIGAGPGGDANAFAYNFFPNSGRGNYIDLDGSSNDAGIFTKALALTGGVTYTATFDLAGSQRNFVEIVDVSFGTTTASYTFANVDPFVTRTLTFRPTATGNYALSFSDRIDNLEGVLLDNVSVIAVPEPTTYGLMLAGLAAVGFVARRRMSN